MGIFRRYSCVKVLFVVVTIVLISMIIRQLSNNNVGNGFLQQCNPVSTATKEDEMNERTQHMHKFCSQYPRRRKIVLNLNGRQMYISEKYRLSYCRVAKVGSTFWTQAFLTLSGVPTHQGVHSHNSIFDVPRDESHQAIQQHNKLLMKLNDSRVHTTTSFLVARNPYSRLFSSYIDQIYIPNKWDKGMRMISSKSKESQPCPNEITFEDFLTSVSENVLAGKAVDLHWAPIFSICIPCSVQVDILAKQETFNEDVDYILNLVGVDQAIKDEIDKALKETNKESLIAGLVHTYVTKAHDREKVKKDCISEKALAERLWSAFQIQGHLHNHVPFPETEFREIVEGQTESKLTELVLEATKQRPLTSAETVNQRQQWKTKFWRTISSDTLQKVQDAFYEDFMTFGYDLDPNTM